MSQCDACGATLDEKGQAAANEWGDIHALCRPCIDEAEDSLR